MSVAVVDDDMEMRDPVPMDTTADASASDASTSASARFATMAMVTLVALWATSSCSVRSVSEPYPAGSPAGFTGAPHALAPSVCTPAPVSLVYGPKVVPSTDMV